MIDIQLPKTPIAAEGHINQEELEAIFNKAGKCPSIKEQLFLKAYEITDTTKMIYDSKHLTILSSQDQTGTYLSCFNKTQEEIKLKIPLLALTLEKKYNAYCVLTAEAIDISDDTLKLRIPDEGLLLVKLKPEA